MFGEELEGLKLLASDPANCSTVAKSEVLESLILVLNSQDQAAELLVLEILEKLLEHGDQRKAVAKFTALYQPVQQLALNSPDESAKALAKKIHETLWPSNNCLEMMKLLAMDPKTCTSLVVDDNVLKNLTVMLTSDDDQVKKLTLESLYQMAELNKHRPRIKNFGTLLDSIKSVHSSHASSEVKDLAQKLEQRLTEEPSTSTAVQTPVKGSASHDSNTGLKYRTNVKDTSTAHKPIKNLGKMKGKTLTFQIKGLDHKDDIELCRSRILSVKGLISITFNFKKKRCIVRAKPDLKPELVAQAIAKTKTMSVTQVIRDDTGNETMVSFGIHQDELEKENEEMPDYPSDCSPVNLDNCVSRTKTDDKPAWGLLKSVGDFLTNSFYW